MFKQSLVHVSFVTAVAAATLPVAQTQIQFSDATVAAGVDHSSETYGASWGDLNGDGFPDLFVSNHRTQPSMYLNRGDGAFLDTATQTFAWINKPKADTHGASWVDFDNDGDQDLLVTTGRGNPNEFLVNERGALIDRTTQFGLTFDNWGGRLPVWLDYNGDGKLDFVMTQMAGVAKVMRQDNGMFSDQTTAVKMNCKTFQYAQLLDVNGDGRQDFICPDETVFPQRIYNTLPLPSTTLTSALPPVEKTIDTVIADFNNDGRLDMFYLSGVQQRPSSVVQDGSNKVEALLMGGEKGFNFVTGGAVTFKLDWNKLDSGYGLPKIYIGAGGAASGCGTLYARSQRGSQRDRHAGRHGGNPDSAYRFRFRHAALDGNSAVGDGSDRDGVERFLFSGLQHRTGQ